MTSEVDGDVPAGGTLFDSPSLEEDPLDRKLSQISFKIFALLSGMLIYGAMPRRRVLLTAPPSPPPQILQPTQPLPPSPQLNGHAMQVDTEYDRQQRTQEDEANITRMVTILATNSYPALLWRSTELLQLGQALDCVHPFKFLEFIFSIQELNPTLRAHVRAIFQDKLIKGRFLGGLSEKMKRPSIQGRLEDLIDPFSAKVGAEAARVRRSIQDDEIDSLVLHLFQIHDARDAPHSGA